MIMKAYKDVLSTIKAITAIELQDKKRCADLREERAAFLEEIRAALQEISDI